MCVLSARGMTTVFGTANATGYSDATGYGRDHGRSAFVYYHEVHHRDLIEGLGTEEVSDIKDFKWLQQLRYNGKKKQFLLVLSIRI